MFSQVGYKIPRGQPMYVISTPDEQEPTKFSVKEVLNAYTNVSGLNDVNQSEIDKVTHYLLGEPDEYSTYIRLKEKFECASVAPEHECTGYHYSDGTGICFGDMIEFGSNGPHSTKLRGEIVKHFTDDGLSYDFRVKTIDAPSMKSPTLTSICNFNGMNIKKVS